MEVRHDSARRATARVRVQPLYGRRRQTAGRRTDASVHRRRRVVHIAVVGVTALVRAGAVLLDDLRVARLQRLRIDRTIAVAAVAAIAVAVAVAMAAVTDSPCIRIRIRRLMLQVVLKAGRRPGRITAVA